MSARSNNHHLIWIASQQFGIRRDLRNLPCAQIKIDIEVHKALHLIYPPPELMPLDVAKRLVDRHKNRECSCYDPSRTITSDILTINSPEE